MTTLSYLLTASLYLLLFYSCYALLLRQNTFFGFNRAYLLASVLLSLTLPLIDLPGETTNSLPIGAITLPAFSVGNLQPTQADGLSAAQWIWLLYGVGAAIMLVRLAIHLRAVSQLIGRGDAERMDAFTLVRLPDNSTPSFSFGRYLVLNQTDSLTEPDALLRHEAAHIRQRHTVDVLFLEIVQAFFWFNPVLWFYKSALQEVHEFLADRAAVCQLSDAGETINRGTVTPTYAHQLVAYALEVPVTALTTPFVSKSTLKQRIVMLQKPQSPRRAMLGYVLALPLAALLVMCTQPDQPQATSSTFIEQNQPTRQAGVDGEIFTVVEQLPEFEGGMAKLGQYLQGSLRYPAAAEKANIQGRVFVSFIVDKTGEVSDIKILKGLGFGIDEEAIRVVQNMPRWKPAMQDGKVVNVRFNLPINFELEPGAVNAKNETDFRHDYNTFVVNGEKVSYEEYQNAEKLYESGRYGIEGWTDKDTKTAYLKLVPIKK